MSKPTKKHIKQLIKDNGGFANRRRSHEIVTEIQSLASEGKSGLVAVSVLLWALGFEYEEACSVATDLCGCAQLELFTQETPNDLNRSPRVGEQILDK